MFRILILLKLIIMKKLQNLIGAKALSQKEQQAIKGGHNIPLLRCCGVTTSSTEECRRACEGK